jgi:hypothetical protein
MKVHSRSLCRLQKRSSFHDCIEISDAADLLQKEYDKYNTLKREAKEARVHFLESLADAIAIEEGRDSAKVLEQLQDRERLKEVTRKLKALKGQSRIRLTQVEVPLDAEPIENDDSRWRLTDIKEEIEQGCVDENIRRFTQANNTPSLLFDAISQLGWTASTELAANILEGNTTTTNLHPCIQRIVPFLQQPATIKERGDIITTISPEDYISSWRKTKEFTSSGKSGIHFGHLKASCRDPMTMNIDRLLLEIPFRTGYTPSRWKTGIDCEIPKKANSLRVTKL